MLTKFLDYTTYITQKFCYFDKDKEALRFAFCPFVIMTVLYALLLREILCFSEKSTEHLNNLRLSDFSLNNGNSISNMRYIENELVTTILEFSVTTYVLFLISFATIYSFFRTYSRRLIISTTNLRCT